MMMKNVCACCLWLVLCGAVSAEHFVGFLDGLQENPPVATPGSGFGTADYDPVTQMLSVAVSFSDLVGATTNAHIHCCASDATMNSGIALHFVPHGFPIGVTSGNFSHTFDLSQASSYDAGFLAASGSGTAAEARDRLLDAMRFGVPNDSNIAYFNIHTSFRAGGEIRGNILVPEPACAVLMLCGMGLVALVRRRSR